MLALVTGQSRVVTNEVMANPKGGSGSHYPEDRNEFVELYNLSDDTIDLRGWRLSDGDDLDTLCAWTDTLIRAKYPHVRTNSTLVFPRSFALVLDPEYTDTAPAGGSVQPYRLSDQLLIVRPGNTTIGNGLSSTDPVMVWSRDSLDVSTFGIWPLGPHDAGDGISWERVAPEAPDDSNSWVRCADSSGSTPGRPNCAATFKNLRCAQLFCYPLTFRPGVAETIKATIRNAGQVPVSDWSVRFFRDINGNGHEDGAERIAFLPGQALAPGRDTLMSAEWQNPEHGVHQIVARLECPGDQDSSDDHIGMTLKLMPTAQSFCLQSELFGPDRAGYPETLGVVYSLPDAKGDLSVRVYDLNGRERAVIFEGRPPLRDGLLSWDGTDRAGRMLPTGLYVIACQYKSGNDLIYEKKPVVLAKGR